MQRPFYLNVKNRNEYLVFILNVLDNKYMINRTKLARAIGLNVNYFIDFIDGRRRLREPNLDKIETYINDLYGAIIEEEWGLNHLFFQELSKDSLNG